MEVVERRLVGEVVWVEVLVKVVVGWLWGSGQGQTHNLGLRVSKGRPWGRSSRGRVAAAGRLFGSAKDVRLRHTVPDRLVGRVQVLLVGGPGLAAGDRLQSVRATAGGPGQRRRAPKVAVTEGGDARAGAARQRGVTAIQDALGTGGRGRYRVEGRLGGGEEGPELERQSYTRVKVRVVKSSEQKSPAACERGVLADDPSRRRWMSFNQQPPSGTC